LEGRLNSLALAHDLASRNEPMELRQLLETELGPFDSEATGRIDLRGPAVWFSQHAASVMALVVHELATNAAKYGALSRPEGSIGVSWHLANDGTCDISWVEQSPVPVSVVARTGFGTLIITRQIPFELGGSSEMSFTPRGLVARLRIPAASIALPPRTSTGRPLHASAATADATAQLLAGRTVLVVEDNLIVALRFEQALKHLGADRIVIAGTLEQAMTLAMSDSVSLVVLDINLRGTRSYAVADTLMERDVPFFFATGYGIDADLPERFKHIPIVPKPSTEAALLRTITSVLGELRPAG
ncbi:MAG TPA: HWE histidine kinase domain-containing protein, partial [Hyphomicrobiaceae bacterium]|nr:HWE histidine kinase domain-containing protein [Hyphomicrobiaceae bacterium]